MNSNTLNTLSSDEDTVGKWLSGLAALIADLEMDIREPEKMSDGGGPNPSSGDGKQQDGTIEDYGLYETDA